jgi:hypothetical protein
MKNGAQFSGDAKIDRLNQFFWDEDLAMEYHLLVTTK